ncbi:MAG: hypothetical protein IPL49_04540 [Saprospirales bacterium]|nr:hypothetical protein [Saprospirales bacterium]
MGTEFGCFFTVDGGGHWKQLKAGLPTVAVRDLAIQKRENDLVIATFGRGFYVLDDYSPLRMMKEADLQADSKIFPIKSGLIYIENLPLGLREKAFQGHSYFTTPNPPIGVSFNYFIKEEVKTLKDKRQEAEKEAIKNGKPIRYPTYEELMAEEREQDPYLEFTIRDLSGNVVRKLKTGVSKGVNRIVWDGRYASVSPINLSPRPEGIFGPLDEGILAMPGAYTVSLGQSINGEMKELVGPVQFELQTLGGVTLPATDRKALVEFQQEAQELRRAFTGASAMLGDINNRLKHIRKAVYAIPTPTADLTNSLKAIDDKVYEIRKALNGDGVAGELDMGAPASVSSRIFGVTYDMWSSTSAPTQTMRDGIRIAGEEFKPQLAAIKQVLNVDIKQLEKKLEEAGAPYTPGREVDWE